MVIWPLVGPNLAETSEYKRKIINSNVAEAIAMNSLDAKEYPYAQAALAKACAKSTLKCVLKLWSSEPPEAMEDLNYGILYEFVLSCFKRFQPFSVSF